MLRVGQAAGKVSVGTSVGAIILKYEWVSLRPIERRRDGYGVAEELVPTTLLIPAKDYTSIALVNVSATVS